MAFVDNYWYLDTLIHGSLRIRSILIVFLKSMTCVIICQGNIYSRSRYCGGVGTSWSAFFQGALVDFGAVLWYLSLSRR